MTLVKPCLQLTSQKRIYKRLVAPKSPNLRKFAKERLTKPWSCPRLSKMRLKATTMMTLRTSQICHSARVRFRRNIAYKLRDCVSPRSNAHPSIALATRPQARACDAMVLIVALTKKRIDTLTSVVWLRSTRNHRSRSRSQRLWSVSIWLRAVLLSMRALAAPSRNYALARAKVRSSMSTIAKPWVKILVLRLCRLSQISTSKIRSMTLTCEQVSTFWRVKMAAIKTQAARVKTRSSLMKTHTASVWVSTSSTHCWPWLIRTRD